MAWIFSLLFLFVHCEQLETTSYTQFYEWLQINGAEISKVEIKEGINNETIGLYVKSDVDEGETIFSIPKSLAISVESVHESPIGIKMKKK